MATIDLNRIATFVRVVEAGSFTGAAARLGVPKSSVSRGVAHLEEELGARLLQRTTRKLMLTDAGFTTVYSVIDGFEGDMSPQGRRTVNGWKNSGLPWTYKLEKAKVFAPLN